MKILPEYRRLTCPICGKEFGTWKLTQHYCSPTCTEQARRDRQRNAYRMKHGLESSETVTEED